MLPHTDFLLILLTPVPVRMLYIHVPEFFIETPPIPIQIGLLHLLRCFGDGAREDDDCKESGTLSCCPNKYFPASNFDETLWSKSAFFEFWIGEA